MADAAASAGQIHASAPSFFVADVPKAAAHYSEVLGFASPQLWGDPPTLAIPRGGGFSVMLSRVDDPTLIRPRVAHEDSFDAYFWVRDADTPFADFKPKGADVVFEPIDRNLYGMREFAVRGLDGHVLIFAHDISGSGG
jgi:catechol 2,3-dioxygenase-like lactoylglutathione lyase family enzyme